MRRSILIAAGAGAGLLGAIFADRRLISRWRANPDPLDGIAPRFPEGDTRVVVTDDGARINTVTAGAGDTVVLVHGLTASRHDWGPIAHQLLSDGFRVVAVEQRGHGDSTVGSDGFGISRQTADLGAVFEDLDLTDVTLVGHSMGGMAAIMLALNRPDFVRAQVRSLCLISTTATMDGVRTQLALSLGSSWLARRFGLPPKGLRVGAGLIAFGEDPSLFMIDEAIASTLRCDDDVRLAATAGLRDYDVSERLHHMDMPAQIICGSLDRLTPLEASLDLHEAIAGSQLEVIDGAGHLVIWEHWERLAALIATTAERHARSAGTVVQ